MNDAIDAVPFKLFSGRPRLVKASIGPEPKKLPFKLFSRRTSNIELHSDDELPAEGNSITAGINPCHTRPSKRPKISMYEVGERTVLGETGQEQYARRSPTIINLVSDEDETSNSGSDSSSSSSSSESGESRDSDTNGGSIRSNSPLQECIHPEIGLHQASIPQQIPSGPRSRVSNSLAARSKPFTRADTSPRVYQARASNAHAIDSGYLSRGEPPDSDVELTSDDDSSDSDYEHEIGEHEIENAEIEENEIGDSNREHNPLVDNVQHHSDHVTEADLSLSSGPVEECFRFFDLPRELRDQVYRFIIPYELEPMDYCRHVRVARNLQPTYLRANKQMRVEALQILHAGQYKLRFAICGPACGCRVANHMSAVSGVSRSYVPQPQMDLRFAKIHQYACNKSFTGAQTRALRSFSHIYIPFKLTEYDYPGDGTWAMRKLAKMLAGEMREAIKDGTHEVELTFHWSWLSPSGTNIAHKLKKLHTWANDFTHKSMIVKVLSETAQNDGERWHLRSKLALSASKGGRVLRA